MTGLVGSGWGTMVLGSQLELWVLWHVNMTAFSCLEGAQVPWAPPFTHERQAWASSSHSHLTLHDLHHAHAPACLPWVSLEPPWCPVSTTFICHSMIQSIPSLLGAAHVAGAWLWLLGLAFLLDGMRKTGAFITYVNMLVYITARTSLKDLPLELAGQIMIWFQ